MTNTDQFVLILSVDQAADRGALLPLLPPPSGERHVLDLRDFGPPPVDRLGAHESLIDWAGLSAALRRMLAKLKEMRGDRSAEYHIAGHAPLPLFALLGHLLQPWAGPQTFYNRAPDGPWHVIPFGQATDPSASAAAPFFDSAPDPHMRPTPAGGIAALYLSTLGTASDTRSIEAVIGDSLAGIEELSLSTPKVYNKLASPVIEREAKNAVSVLKGLYPRAHGLALFVAGPAQLAYLAGRAVNPKVFDDLRIYYRRRDGSQELAFVVPEPTCAPAIENTPEGRAARREVWDRMLDSFEELKQNLTADDLPPKLTESSRGEFCRRLGALRPDRQPAGSGFWLRTLEDRLQLGDDLLEPARQLSPDDQKRFFQIVLLHELLHFDQRLDRYNHHNIGSAGFVLEEVDFWADAFAIGTLAAWELRCGDRRGQGLVAGRTVAYVRAALRGIIVFDRLEHGERIEQLAERRLRRYLIWHLQLLRAHTLKDDNQSPHDLFAHRLVVEMAPLAGYLDARHEKFVRSTLADTELCLAYDGKLVRIRKSSSFSPERLLTAICDMQEAAAGEQMRHVLHEARDLLTPWRSNA